MAVERAARKDQVRNRERLLAAARDAFAELGPDVSLAEVARRAGVGPTTFYRHFPTKDDLVAALLDDLATGAQLVAERAEKIDDAWEAFRLVFTEGCVLSESDLTLFDLLARYSPGAGERTRTLTAQVISPLVERAREAGALRAGVTTEDVATFMRMADAAGPGARRSLALDVLLDGLRSSRAGAS